MNISMRRSLFYSTAVSALMAAASHGAAAANPTVAGGGSTLAALDYDTEFLADTSGHAFISYCSVGSGAGTSAFVSNTLTPLKADPACAAYTVTAIDYGASDSVITAANITLFASLYKQPLIQVPMFGTPITIPFNVAGKTTDGSINLTDAQLCSIFSGAVTNWNTINSTIPSSTIEVAYRSDSSGTSFLFTNHLKSVCPATTTGSGFTSAQLAAMPTQTFGTSLFGGSLPALPATFHAETGSSGVKNYISSTPNATGYLSPDYTDIATKNHGVAGFPVVAEVNGILPTVANTSLALGTIAIPTGANASNQLLWAPLVPKPTAGYPIAGWTQWFTATCYKSQTVVNDLTGFLTDHYNISDSAIGKTLVGDITSSGFTPVPGSSSAAVASGFALALYTTFLSSSATSKLNIALASATSTDTTCEASTVVGR